MEEIKKYFIDTDDEGFVIREIGKNYSIPLDKRIFNFAVRVIKYLKTIDKSTINNVIIYQLTKAATSQGANYEEAQGASSKKDFLAKTSIAHREAKESAYWLRIILAAEIDANKELNDLIREATELRNILGSIVGKVRRGKEEGGSKK